MSLILTMRFSKVPPILRYSSFFCCKSILALSNYQNSIHITRTLAATPQYKSDVKISSEARYPTVNKESLVRRILNKIPFFNLQKYKLQVAGYLLYESVADKINYSEFFDEFELPDTFYSWFVITEIHVWLLMVRCMAEGEDGRIIRNAIVQAMWADVGLRAQKLGAHNPSGVRAQIHELSEQFQAALIAYDEGLQSNDMVLAGAIWRRLYQQRESNPEHLDCMVNYIRKQARSLDTVTKEYLVSQKKISWESLNRK